MKISIFGLGYVGTVSAAGVPADGHQVVGVDSVAKVCDEIGACFAGLGRFHVIAIRSTMLPGSIRSTVAPALKHQGICW